MSDGPSRFDYSLMSRLQATQVEPLVPVFWSDHSISFCSSLYILHLYAALQLSHNPEYWRVLQDYGRKASPRDKRGPIQEWCCDVAQAKTVTPATLGVENRWDITAKRACSRPHCFIETRSCAGCFKNVTGAEADRLIIFGKSEPNKMFCHQRIHSKYRAILAKRKVMLLCFTWKDINSLIPLPPEPPPQRALSNHPYIVTPPFFCHPAMHSWLLRADESNSL